MLISLPQKSPLMEQARQLMRTRHMSIRTEQAYLNWMMAFLRFHRERSGRWQQPAELGSEGVNVFLTYLAVERNVAASTQNQALSALLFLYKQVLERAAKCRPGTTSEVDPKNWTVE